MKDRIYVSREQMIWLPPAEREQIEAGTHPNLFTREAVTSQSARRILAGESAFIDRPLRRKSENRGIDLASIFAGVNIEVRR